VGVVGLLALALLGCPKDPGAARAPTAGPGQCPTFTSAVDESQCLELPDGYGTTAEAPLEWGLAARGNEALYFGRLICPNGATADTTRVGSIGAAPVRSAAPLADEEPFGGTDILDAWSVSCPGLPTVTLYANTYRCGNPCPPPPYRLLPATATTALERSRVALDAQDLETAAGAAKEAATAEPESEIVQAWLGMVLLRADRPVPALDAFQAAQRMDPFDPWHRLHEAYAYQALEQGDRAEAVLDELRATLPSDHELTGDVTCMKAWAVRSRVGEAEARGLAEAACARGVGACCPDTWGP
jgi:hypothetical protein